MYVLVSLRVDKSSGRERKYTERCTVNNILLLRRPDVATVHLAYHTRKRGEYTMAIFKRKRPSRVAMSYLQVLSTTDPQLLNQFLGHALHNGVSVNFFPLRDRSAIGVSLYKDGDTEKFYPGSKKALNRVLNAAIEAWNGAAVDITDDLVDFFGDDIPV